MIFRMIGEYVDQLGLNRSICVEMDSNDPVELPESESYWQVQNAMCTNFYHGSPEFDLRCRVYAAPKKFYNGRQNYTDMQFMDYSKVQELLKQLDGELFYQSVVITLSDEWIIYDLIEEALYLSDKEVSRDEIKETVDSETIEIFLKDTLVDYMSNSETTNEFIPWFVLTFLQGLESYEDVLQGGNIYGDVAKNLAAIYFDVETDF